MEFKPSKYLLLKSPQLVRLEKQETLLERAERILESMQNDVGLIPIKFQQWWKYYLDVHHCRYLETLVFVTMEGKTGNFVDIGCVPGHFTILLKKLGYNVMGVDIDPYRMGEIWNKHNIAVEQVDVENNISDKVYEQEPRYRPRYGGGGRSSYGRGGGGGGRSYRGNRRGGGGGGYSRGSRKRY